MHTEATGHSCRMWFNKNTCDGRYLQSPYPPFLTIPPSLPQPSLSFPPLPLSPPVHPNSATYPPQTHSNTCTVVRKGYIYVTYVAVLGGISNVHMQQSWVVFRMYICGSPGWYFENIMIEMLKQKGQVYMHYIDLSGVHASTMWMSITLNSLGPIADISAQFAVNANDDSFYYSR